MVLIIRNNRILSSRHPRIKRFLSYIHKNQQKLQHKDSSNTQNKNTEIMSLTAVLLKLFLYSVAMFTLPFATFFGVEHVLKVEFHFDRFVTNCISVFAAVIMVNLIIACYAYQALHEPDSAEVDAIADQPSKSDLNKKSD
ncbi:uncharacterized protein LOC105663266 [Megachile rotundata]|uniref:uncharacterized protein LOC105663266 n=1 Tax=Megachile rotundata TaxID=143995 RepID=UPI0006152EAC|nr:PREDICTED: uncharacterized protein LOC105663266 [Megachile rotundata]